MGGHGVSKKCHEVLSKKSWNLESYVHKWRSGIYLLRGLCVGCVTGQNTRQHVLTEIYPNAYKYEVPVSVSVGRGHRNNLWCDFLHIRNSTLRAIFFGGIKVIIHGLWISKTRVDTKMIFSIVTKTRIKLNITKIHELLFLKTFDFADIYAKFSVLSLLYLSYFRKKRK